MSDINTLVVEGYIRESKQTLRIKPIIPLAISRLILEFQKTSDVWNAKISDRHVFIHPYQPSRLYCHHDNTSVAYGTHVVKPNEVKTWIVNIEQHNFTAKYTIGMVECQKAVSSEYPDWIWEYHGHYGLFINRYPGAKVGKQYHQYHVRQKWSYPGQTVKVTVDLQKYVVSVQVDNGKCLDYSVNHQVFANLGCRFAISISGASIGTFKGAVAFQ